MQIKSAVSVTLDPDDIAEAVADYVRKHNAGDGPEIDRGSLDDG